MLDIPTLIDQGETHWKKYLPKKYSRLEANGTLQKKLAEAAHQTQKEMEQLQEMAGLRDYEAWEAVRERYLILPSETD